ncbi:hypothetical protein [Vibrio halioticoli]|uniref:hypothetical protein n=1 Tax=Vibrio halioticoli TaxID=71388 RepID=UPI00041B9A62|nr:hypothetical protein [Vibrio halioticoli]
MDYLFNSSHDAEEQARHAVYTLVALEWLSIASILKPLFEHISRRCLALDKEDSLCQWLRLINWVYIE